MNLRDYGCGCDDYVMRKMTRDWNSVAEVQFQTTKNP